MNELRDKIAKVAFSSINNEMTMRWEDAVKFERCADAIIAALPGMVPDLVWDDIGDKWGTVTCGRIQITRKGCDPCWGMSCCSPDADFVYTTLEAAQAAANAHNRAQVMAGLGVV